VLLRSRATCRLSRIFSEILQDRHRPPSDLADGLMRNSSSGQTPHWTEKRYSHCLCHCTCALTPTGPPLAMCSVMWPC
jgi:hypothetical protein